MDELFIKKVSKCKGGNGGEYGRVTLPKELMGEIVLVRIATEKEIKKYGMTIPKNWDPDGWARMDKRKVKLDKHLKGLRKERLKRGAYLKSFASFKEESHGD